MNDAFWNTVRGVVANQIAQIGVGRHAIVASVDAARGVRVMIDEGDLANGIPPTLTGWLPVAQFAAGNGWSGVCLPPPGTQVFMVPDMGDQSHMVVVGAVHSTAAPMGKITPYKATSPIPIVPGEITFMHASGASLRLTADGVIEMRATLKVDGDIVATGQVTAMDGAGAVHLSTHTHTQPNDGHGDGEQPTNAPTPGT